MPRVRPSTVVRSRLRSWTGGWARAAWALLYCCAQACESPQDALRSDDASVARGDAGLRDAMTSDVEASTDGMGARWDASPDEGELKSPADASLPDGALPQTDPDNPECGACPADRPVCAHGTCVECDAAHEETCGEGERCYLSAHRCIDPYRPFELDCADLPANGACQGGPREVILAAHRTGKIAMLDPDCERVADDLAFQPGARGGVAALELYNLGSAEGSAWFDDIVVKGGG